MATRGETAVVRHLEDAQTRRLEGRRNLILDLTADVTGQDDRHVPPSKLDHDRVVVAHVLALPVGHRRMMDGHLDPVDEQMIVTLDTGPPRSGRLRVGHQADPEVELSHGHAVPHVARPELPHDR
jgi:hypothetical protein